MPGTLRSKGARVAIAGAILLALSGCASSPQLPPPSPNLDARLAYAKGKSAFDELEIRAALDHLHLAVHLDRELLEAQDLFARAAYTVSCGPGAMPCAFSGYRGRPDVWAGLPPDLTLHVRAAEREAERLRAAGKDHEASEYLRCAEALALLQAPLCPPE